MVVDLWAAWCGPCKMLTPIIEKVVGETDGRVELAKVDVDANPQIAQAFAVQSIPSVFALRDGQVVDSFVGALPESAVRDFVQKLVASSPTSLDPHDEGVLRGALAANADDAVAGVALGEFLLAEGRYDEAESVLEPFVTQVAAKTVLARVRLTRSGVSLSRDVDLTLEQLLERSSSDAQAKDSLLEMLDALGPEDPRYVSFRRRLASRLY